MKVVSFVNMKGGVAKTTLAVNVADCLSRRYDFKTLLIDTDPQFNATQCLLSGEQYVDGCKNGKHTILNVFDDSTSISASSVGGATVIQPVEVEKIEPWNIKENFDLLPGNLELHKLDTGGGQGREQRLKRFINYLKSSSRYDIVIIDTPPTPSAWMAAALIASDYYAVPVKPEPLSATGIDLLKAVINRIATNHALSIRCAGVILTIAEVSTIVYRGTINFIDNNDFWRGRRFKYPLPKRTLIAREQGSQRLILDLHDVESNRALTRITQELLSRMDIRDV